ncbi:MAG: protein TolQ [Tistrella sp.]|uniref:Tol-Pal system protein TolQ n=1 Tax=Tistrella mobilis TaxID=171437 RepID=A0A3B9IPV1_9PROT|nr:protein TolQ [Tistrella sp.]HAE49728.1 protein TolQ [Tistrella mobilis]|tara:strand:- start:33 stop:767 length:735 start_codon:yes stop_codon:yes gene_type:complete
MEQEVVSQAALAGSVAAHDMSILSLVMNADIIVKAVMLMLVLASVWSWAIIFDKFRLMGRLKRRADDFENRFWSGGSLEELYDAISERADHPMAQVFAAAMGEWRRAKAKGTALTDATSRANLRQRIQQVMEIALNREMAGLERNLGFLATVGSTAPFVGLFGTVWGIMNSFTSIAMTKNTTLAVVAPGIAEALFATAIGLVAAIPAVIFYNKLSSDVGRYGARLENFTGEFGALIARQIEDRR